MKNRPQFTIKDAKNKARHILNILEDGLIDGSVLPAARLDLQREASILALWTMFPPIDGDWSNDAKKGSQTLRNVLRISSDDVLRQLNIMRVNPLEECLTTWGVSWFDFEPEVMRKALQWIASVGTVATKSDSKKATNRRGGWVERAVRLAEANPGWNKNQIAKIIGRDASQLSRNQTFNRWWNKNHGDMPHGYHDEAGDIDAFDASPKGKRNGKPLY